MIKKPKAFLVLSPAFPENEQDSNWVPAQQIFVRVFKETHPEIKIFVLSFRFPPFTSVYSFYNCEVRSFGNFKKSPYQRIFIWIRVWKNLCQLSRNHEIVGILSFWYGECALLGHWFSKFYKKKHRAWLMGQDAKKTNPLAKWIGSTGEELIAISDFIQSEFYKNHKIKPQYMVPLGIYTKLFPPNQENKSIDILGVGSLIPLKRFDYFIEIIREIIPYFPNLKVCICGEGPERNHLVKKIKNNSLENHIELTGLLPYPNVLDYMSRTKVLLHTSEYEGFALVFLEALYSGAQVISLVKPLNHEIKNWKIALNHKDLISLLKSALNNENHFPISLVPYSMESSVEEVLNLFNYKEEAIF